MRVPKGSRCESNDDFVTATSRTVAIRAGDGAAVGARLAFQPQLVPRSLLLLIPASRQKCFVVFFLLGAHSVSGLGHWRTYFLPSLEAMAISRIKRKISVSCRDDGRPILHLCRRIRKDSPPHATGNLPLVHKEATEVEGLESNSHNGSRLTTRIQLQLLHGDIGSVVCVEAGVEGGGRIGGGSEGKLSMIWRGFVRFCAYAQHRCTKRSKILYALAGCF